MVLAAFPQELKHVLKNLKVTKKEKKRPLTICEASYGPHGIVAVRTGMGPFETDDALEGAIIDHKPDYLLSIGFGGALYDGAKAGELVWGKRFMLHDKGKGINQKDDIKVAEKKPVYEKLKGKLDIKEGTIITITERTAKQELRQTLPENTRFPVCDMETFHIARLALKRGVPFFAVRSITDRLDEEIPEELFGVCDEEGNFKFTRAMGILARKPALIPDSVRLGGVSAGASKNLWLALKSLIEVLEE